tara:strand:+ start:2678 stop:2971 length:294 start_codon:yes stop_codon:yes gene_type:complete
MGVAYKVGSTVEYMSGDCDPLMSNKLGVITEVASDNFDDVKVTDDKQLVYWSKKTKSYRPVKDKDMCSIYYTIESPNVRYPEFVEPSQIVGTSPRPV